MEKELLAWCKDKWNNNKSVSRGVIFHQALKLYPGHCGGLENPAIFERLKNWFYGGFKQRWDLSKRRVSSTGQKLPIDWETKGAQIVARVAGAQMPVQKPDGKLISGVKDDDMGNMDHMPCYTEDHRKGVWGIKSSQARRCITTGGKEKSRFTTQLTIFKSGRKVINCMSF